MSLNAGGVSLAALAQDCAVMRCHDPCAAMGRPLGACEVCTFGACPEKMNACFGSPECFDLVACIGECADGDVMCTDACLAMYPGATELVGAVIECAYEQCPDVCD